VSARARTLIGAAAVVVIGASIGLLAWFRIQESRHLTQPCTVQTYGGTNYVFQVLETTVGKIDTGYAVIVYARLANPNPYEVVLNRKWFVLVDHDKDYFQPSTTGTQTELIKLPPNGVVEKESLSFAVPDDSFGGTIGLQIGMNYWVMIKDEKPFIRKLQNGAFITFRSRNW
jgi:hypothetical protein